MLRYDLDRLGWFEFEQLVQTLLKIRLGFGVEAWGGHRDLGRDAYFEGALKYPTASTTRGIFLFQCKFVESANSAGAKPAPLLLGAIRKECENIRRLQRGFLWKRPTVYALFTNSPASPIARAKIEQSLRGVMPSATIAIHDGNDICQWLSATPEVVRSFPQLLSISDLQQWLQEVVHADVRSRSETAIALATAQAKVFVPTEAYFEARAKLSKHRFVVLEGPPEMGKTTIGRLIALSQVASDWEAIECREPADVLKMYRRDSAQIFVADDFFGRTEYHPERVSKWQDDLPLILPKLNARHWLVLTSRAHLLEMGKARLDVAGENDRFPRLGEVIVNAGRLTRTEKARILYRHAKAADLSPVAKNLVRNFALLIVSNPHFTPERIRRLVVEIIPTLANQKLSQNALPAALDEALANPTREMRISFRALPDSHRWLLFALLESDDVARWDSWKQLRGRYEELCPPENQIPYQKVLAELTEAFVKRTETAIQGEQINWIHPSGRDLAIEELAANPKDRLRFLQNCSAVGVELATSLAGGAKGDRQLPLLQTQHDWKALHVHAGQLIQNGTPLISLVWQNLKVARSAGKDDRTTEEAITGLQRLLAKTVLPVALDGLRSAAYDDDFNEINAFFEAGRELELSLQLDLAPQWNAMVKDIDDWASSPDDVWDQSNAPADALRFVNLVKNNQQFFLRSKGVKESLQVMLDQIRQRANADAERADDVAYEDQLAGRAEACSQLARTFSQFGLLQEAGAAERADFLKIGAEFGRTAEELSEQVPRERDEDDSSYFPSGDREVSVTDLFRDL